MLLHTKLSGLRAATAFSVCLLSAPVALADAMPPADGPDGPPFGQMHEHVGEPGPFGTPPFLRGLGLSDEQNDRVFTILHSQAPKRRALENAERKADDALRDLARAPELDQARASGAAQALGQAIADQELLRLQTRALLKAVLTPQQRGLLDAPPAQGRKAERKADHKSKKAHQEAGK